MTHEWQGPKFKAEDIITKPSPTETAAGLRFAAIILFITAFIFGLQGGWLAMVCMILTVSGVVLLALAKSVLNENL